LLRIASTFLEKVGIFTGGKKRVRWAATVTPFARGKNINLVVLMGRRGLPSFEKLGVLFSL